MSSLDIKEQFNLIAEEYDKNRRKFIPCFDDYYVNTTRFIASNITAPNHILDLGAGTGLLSYYWYKHFPTAEYLLVDIADDMLGVARKRFKGLSDVGFKALDYLEGLPEGDFEAIISALSIHHLEAEEKARLFSQVYDKLPQNGIFVNYDQFCDDDVRMNSWFNTYWENQLATSGLTEKDIELWKERKKLDRECSVEKETEMLSSCSFGTVKCVYSYQKFSVIVAIK